MARPGKMTSTESFRQDFTSLCTTCGQCAAMCPPFTHRTVRISDREVQEQVRSFLDNGPLEEAVLERSRLCDECYKCVTDTCPAGLDPMRVNQLLRGLLHDRGELLRPFIPPSNPQSTEKIMASLLTTEAEYRRITTPAVKGRGRVLFFPGCNIYYQPNLLLTALDILELISADWTFLPGLDHCCGNNHDSAGRLTAGGEAMEELSTSLESAGVDTVAVWCPTCAARFHHAGSGLPVISFARFVADRLGGFPKERVHWGGVTLHEACKTGYLDLDPEAPRELLSLVTGEPVKEMARHGFETVCCGWSLHQNRPEAGDENREVRLFEAAATGAQTLATICHGCQWILDSPGVDTDLRVVSYVRLVGEAFGIRHPERFRKLRRMGDTGAVIESIRESMGDQFNRLPFDRDRIHQAVGEVLGGGHSPKPKVQSPAL